MSTKLMEAYEEFALSTTKSFEGRIAFFCGAAAMAELFAAGQGPVLEELKALRTQMQEHAHMIADAAAHD